MPYNDPDETDPMTIHGVEATADDIEAVREMADCFIEEFVRLGHGEAAMREIFLSGEFAGPALALRQLGESEIKTMIRAAFERRGPRAGHVPTERTAAGDVSLPVLFQ